MNYNAISGNASRLRHSPNSNRGLAEIVRNYSPYRFTRRIVPFLLFGAQSRSA